MHAWSLRKAALRSICFSLSLVSYCSRRRFSAAAASFLWLFNSSIAAYLPSTSACHMGQPWHELLHQALICQLVKAVGECWCEFAKETTKVLQAG